MPRTRKHHNNIGRQQIKSGSLVKRTIKSRKEMGVMAHDKQYKDTVDGMMIVKFDYPKKGEAYWDRHKHEIVVADRDVEEKFCIVERGE